MEFSIIIPTLNEEVYIEACLKSISKQTLPRDRFEIIVSDGSSSDRTREIARKYADKVVVSKKRGIWWGRNQGAKVAKGTYLVFIDADTRIKEDYLETVKKYLDCGIVGLTAGFEIEGIGLKMKIFECLGCGFFWLSSNFRNTSLIGINLCVPRDVFIKVGGFKDYALEDAAFDRELKKVGQTRFLMQRKVVTSARRLEAYGVIGLCRYYFELGMMDGGKINSPHIAKFIKYQEYKPIRMPAAMPMRTSGRQRVSEKCENVKTFGKQRIERVEKMVLKWT
ncbi:Glycosyltransferase AglE [uncultured archaeon]|nr:Glycosyltransferase AglE [uncultured archaeon]